jgi:hypothetical protein
MTNKITLTALIIMLIATSGALAAGTARVLPHRSAVPASGQALRSFNSFDSAASPSAAEPNAHRYHGRPKSND